MRYIPLFLESTGFNVLIIGAGDVAERKLTILMRTNASITVIAPQILPAILEHAAKKNIVIYEREVQHTDLDIADIVFLATDNNLLNCELATLCKQKGKLVNVVDNLDACSVIMPAIVDRGHLQIAISSSGVSPVLVKDIRSKLEAMLPFSLIKLLEYIAPIRNVINNKFTNTKERRKFWESFFIKNGYGYNENTKSYLEDYTIQDKSYIYGLDITESILNLNLKAIYWLQRVDLVYYTDLDDAKKESLFEFIRRDSDRIHIKNINDIEIEEGANVLIISNQNLLNSIYLKYPLAQDIYKLKD